MRSSKNKKIITIAVSVVLILSMALPSIIMATSNDDEGNEPTLHCCNAAYAAPVTSAEDSARLMQLVFDYMSTHDDDYVTPVSLTTMPPNHIQIVRQQAVWCDEAVSEDGEKLGFALIPLSVEVIPLAKLYDYDLSVVEFSIEQNGLMPLSSCARGCSMSFAGSSTTSQQVQGGSHCWRTVNTITRLYICIFCSDMTSRTFIEVIYGPSHRLQNGICVTCGWVGGIGWASIDLEDEYE